MLNGTHRIDFDYGRDVVMDVWHRMAAHPNGIRFQAFDRQNNLIDEQVWYSIGGGFVRQGDADDLMIGIHEKPLRERPSPIRPTIPQPISIWTCPIRSPHATN